MVALLFPMLPNDKNCSLREAIEQFEYCWLIAALKRTGGNQSAAARLLGLGRTTFVMKLRKYEIEVGPLDG